MTGSVVPTRFLVALKATGTSTLKVVEILVALKSTVDRNVNPHCWQVSSSSKNYGNRVKKVANPPKKKILNVVDPHFSQCGGPTCEGEQGDSLCGEPQVI